MQHLCHGCRSIKRLNRLIVVGSVTAAIFFAASARTSAQSSRAAPHQPVPPTSSSSSGTPGVASPASTPVPGTAVLMSEVLANQNRVDKIRENYTCLDTHEVDSLGKHGNVKKRTTYVYQVSFLLGEQLQRLIENDGKPLSTAGQKKEDRRIRQQIRKIEKEQADGRLEKKENQEMIAAHDFLRSDRFFDRRAVRIAGRTLIAFDFERNPNFKPKTLMERVAQALAGTIWIDPRSHELARLEAHVASNLRIYGPLLAVHKGTAVVVEQAFIDNQVWLPTYTEFHINGRLLLFHGIKLSGSDRYTDYKVFHVQTRSTISSPSQGLQRRSPGKPERPD